jgi:hypothetical protein
MLRLITSDNSHLVDSRADLVAIDPATPPLLPCQLQPTTPAHSDYRPALHGREVRNLFFYSSPPVPPPYPMTPRFLLSYIKEFPLLCERKRFPPCLPQNSLTLLWFNVALAIQCPLFRSRMPCIAFDSPFGCGSIVLADPPCLSTMHTLAGVCCKGICLFFPCVWGSVKEMWFIAYNWVCRL